MRARTDPDKGVRTLDDATGRTTEQPISRLWRRPLLCLALIGAVGLVTVVLGFALDYSTAQAWFSENHLVENLTLLAYFAAVGLLLLWPVAPGRFRYHTAFVVALGAMRELDLHNAFTSESFMKISYYVDGDDPAWARAISGVILLGLLAILIRYLAYVRPLIAALKRGRPDAYSALAAILLLPFTKTLDSVSRMIHEHVGYDVSDDIRHWFYLFEEALELAIPLLIILAMAQYSQQHAGAPGHRRV